jgi:ABC-type transport system involved in multi-copper enzyme maturation permease subunit
MFKELFKRQIFEDIISLRFLINFVLVLATLIIFPLIFVNHYQGMREIHTANVAENNLRIKDASESLINLITAEQELLMRPKVWGFISNAYEDKMPQGLSFRLYEIKLLSEERESDALSFYSPDLTFVVQFLLSFFAIVLTFNAITSEKERGTLRLVFSNPIKRAYLISIKYLSALVTVVLPLLFGIVVGLILLNLLKAISFSFGLFLDFILFFLISLIYVSFFILLGIFCSTATHSSKNSLVLCLLFWILLVIILPKSAGLLLSLKRLDVPTEKQIEELADKSYREVWDRHVNEDLTARGGQDESTKQNVKVANEAQRARQEVFDFYIRKKIAAVSTLRRINFISPSSLLEYSASSIAGTGLFHFQNLWTQVKQYQTEFREFFKREDMKDESSYHLYFDSDYLSKKPVDFEKIPKFEEKEIKRAERLKDAIQYAGILALYNLFLFSLVFYKFLKYDVR